MFAKSRQFLAPAYLFACLILGGSAQGIWAKMILQLAGIAIIAWAAMDKGREPLARRTKQLLFIGILGLSVVALQLIPLPASVWPHLGPRGALADGFRGLGLSMPAEPLSLTPAESLDSLLGIIPALALVCAMVRLKAYRPGWLAVALISGTVAGIALGTLQVANSRAILSPWYLYQDTSPGRAVGFFANADHMATLLVIAIPFLAALVAAEEKATMQRYSVIVAVGAGLALLMVVGLALNGSLAGYGLTLPVIAASALILLPPASRLRLWAVALAALFTIGALVALERTAIGSGEIGAHATSSVQSRAELVTTTLRAAGDFMPFGSGLGSFRSVYPLYESHDLVTSTYVIHAHNDYVEIALELGLAGIVLMLLFLAWWASAVWRVWRTAEAGPFARAAAIGSAAILIHSLVDFPLRTAAISACFGMCLALLADSRAAPPREKTELRRSRHLEFR